MRRILLGTVTILTALAALLSGGELRAEEHPGKHLEEQATVNPEQVKEAILDYIHRDTELKGGYFLLWDDKEKRVLKLDFSELHKKVNVLEDETYFMCVDFNAREQKPDGSVNTETLDIDFWLKQGENGKLNVSRIKVHKVDGVAR